MLKYKSKQDKSKKLIINTIFTGILSGLLLQPSILIGQNTPNLNNNILKNTTLEKPKANQETNIAQPASNQTKQDGAKNLGNKTSNTTFINKTIIAVSATAILSLGAIFGASKLGLFSKKEKPSLTKDIFGKPSTIKFNKILAHLKELATIKNGAILFSGTLIGIILSIIFRKTNGNKPSNSHSNTPSGESLTVKENSNLEKEKESLLKKEKELEEKNKLAEKQKSDLEKDKENLEKDKNALNSQKSALEKDKNTLSMEKSDLEKDKSDLENQKNLIQKENSDLETIKSSTKTKETDLAKREDSIAAKETELTEKEAELINRTHALDNALKKANTELTEKQEESAKILNALEQKKDELESIKKIILEKQETSEKEIIDLENKITTQKFDLNSLENKLKEQKSKLEAEIELQKTNIAVEKERLEKELLEKRKNFETAIQNLEKSETEKQKKITEKTDNLSKLKNEELSTLDNKLKAQKLELNEILTEYLKQKRLLEIFKSNNEKTLLTASIQLNNYILENGSILEFILNRANGSLIKGKFEIEANRIKELMQKLESQEKTIKKQKSDLTAKSKTFGTIEVLSKELDKTKVELKTTIAELESIKTIELQRKANN